MVSGRRVHVPPIVLGSRLGVVSMISPMGVGGREHSACVGALQQVRDRPCEAVEGDVCFRHGRGPLGEQGVDFGVAGRGDVGFAHVAAQVDHACERVPFHDGGVAGGDGHGDDVGAGGQGLA